MAAAVEAGGPSRIAGLVSRRKLSAVPLATFLICLAIAALDRSSVWRPVPVVLVLAAFTVVTEVRDVEFSLVHKSLGSISIALTMTFLGPAPAVTIAVLAILADSLNRRLRASLLLSNIAHQALFTLVGSLGIGALLGGYPPRAGPGTVLLAVALLTAFIDLLSALLFSASRAILGDVSMRWVLRRVVIPLAPYEMITAAFTGAAAMAYLSAGFGALVGLLAVLLISQQLVLVVAAAQEREQLVAELALARARLLGEALTAEERERVRLAGEIHDDALQELAIARLDLRGVEGADGAARRLEAADRALRATLSRIVPAAEMRTGGLAAALEALAGDLCEPARLAWEVSVDPALEETERTLVCSLARELVTNVVKHAGAARVSIEARRSEDGVRLRVVDDGRGFDPSRTARGGHVGLSLVENRARAAGGHLLIESAPGAGTTVEVSLGGPDA
jgi:two-component system, NarL family, sensor kinase